MTNEDTYSGAYVEFLNARIMQEQARAEAAERKVARVEALHAPDAGNCAEGCPGEYPCATVRALAADQTPDLMQDLIDSLDQTKEGGRG